MTKMLILLAFAFFTYPNATQCKNVSFAKPVTTIKFNLRSGSQLFISYPVSLTETEELILPAILHDTSVTLTIFSPTPFTLFNLNKISTQYLFFPNFSYEVEIEKSQAAFNFTCNDSYKANECNALKGMQEQVGSFDIGDRDESFNSLFKQGVYNRKLDAFYAEKKSIRLAYFEQLYSTGKISRKGFETLESYNELAFIRNRFVQFYNGKLKKSAIPDWYKDTMQQYKKVLEDTSLLNTSVFKSSIRCMNLFSALVTYGNDALTSQFSIAHQMSANSTIRDMLLYFVMNSKTNRQDKQYPLYIDSLKQYVSDLTWFSSIVEDYKFASVNSKVSLDDFLVNADNRRFKLDSLLRTRKQVIVADFWASWCVPCIASLNQNSTGEDTPGAHYIYISLDDNFSKWKSASARYPFMNEDNSFILEGGFNSFLAKRAAIETIPFFIIFNEQGHAVKMFNESIKKDALPALINQISER